MSSLSLCVHAAAASAHCPSHSASASATSASPPAASAVVVQVDGVPTTADHWLLTEQLRGEFGFDGYVRPQHKMRRQTSLPIASLHWTARA